MEIIRTPNNLDALRGANVFRVVAMGLILYTIAFTISEYAAFINVALRKQSYDIMLTVPQVPGKLPAMPTVFSFTGTIATGLFQTTLIPLLLLATLFFLIHRVFTRTPLSYTAVLGITAYSLSITAIGRIITTVLQSISGSVTATLSAGMFVSYNENIILFSILSKIDVFMVWQYWAIATSDRFVHHDAAIAAINNRCTQFCSYRCIYCHLHILSILAR